MENDRTMLSRKLEDKLLFTLFKLQILHFYLKLMSIGPQSFLLCSFLLLGPYLLEKHPFEKILFKQLQTTIDHGIYFQFLLIAIILIL